ncbi:glycerophosphodiester phosphodiesterase [uncultured Pseudokineococcus sp.]|uniref:glycerophosphodiester phosphodiesterase n=1 Tax=uncultured Pseudokineococcus sp. TaxID=1642928 RepID=UPI002607DA71|nr:glycerophosphodiester phosphodiesterase [uncultured Pseudokineococcus sp.]
MTTTRRVPAPAPTPSTPPPAAPGAAAGPPTEDPGAPPADPPDAGAAVRRGPRPLLRRAPGAPPAVVAHRGSSSTAPENTLAAFEAARRAGAPWVETDLRRTRDGVAVVLHDPRMERTTDGAGDLAGLTAAEVAALDAGSWFAPGFGGARVPLLDELLDWAAAHDEPHLLLELKGSWTPAEVAPVVAAVRARGLAERVVLQSFDAGTVAACAHAAPDLALGLLLREGGGVPLLEAGGGTPDGPGHDATGGPPRVSEEVRRLVAEHRLSAVNPGARLVVGAPEVVGALHDLGVAVWVWTVDDAARWAQLEEAGADGVITNRPDRMLGWVEGRRSPVPAPRRGGTTTAASAGPVPADAGPAPDDGTTLAAP